MAASGGQEVRTTLAINASLRYAAHRGLAEPPRHPGGGLGGPGLSEWFKRLYDFAETDSSEHALRFLAELEAIESTPESA